MREYPQGVYFRSRRFQVYLVVVVVAPTFTHYTVHAELSAARARWRKEKDR